MTTQMELNLQRPRVVRAFITGYRSRGSDLCGHAVAVEICHGDAKRVLCDACGEWLIEFGVHRDGVLSPTPDEPDEDE